MAGEAHQSQAIIESASRSLQHQRQGGRRAPSIGRGSAELKRRALVRRAKLIAASVAAILLAAIAAGLVVGGIGLTGVMLVALAIVAAVVVFGAFPTAKTPRREDLNRGDVRQMVGRTELWLEHQRPALPPPAVQIVDTIGVQLDALGLQLEGVDPVHPAAIETRKLVGETLPGMIDAYRKIPPHLRKEERVGSTPERQIVESLGKISQEIDEVTRQLADGALDDLAIRTRFLEYKYGTGDEPMENP
ncbi:hypothetical protein [Altericroceibacterium xinjiangense]|uniref:hypothetical protein n=1 Tax=Altericroceibacterium xinjiangense TaxID=762261 RepID=UPI000F7D8180|nr:hypothetical protein [Altericroceibacterium xinjiangense]